MGTQHVMDCGPDVFGVERISPDGGHRVIALHNVTGNTVAVTLAQSDGNKYRDLLSGDTVEGSTMELAPYRIAWLKAD
jgi:hypothetical protein